MCFCHVPGIHVVMPSDRCRKLKSGFDFISNAGGPAIPVELDILYHVQLLG
jgi:hypothetical protein